MKCAFCGVEVLASNGVVWKESPSGSIVRSVIAWHSEFDNKATKQRKGRHCWTFDRDRQLEFNALVRLVNKRGPGRVGTEVPQTNANATVDEDTYSPPPENIEKRQARIENGVLFLTRVEFG